MIQLRTNVLFAVSDGVGDRFLPVAECEGQLGRISYVGGLGLI